MKINKSFTRIADFIRTKNGTSERISRSELAAEIEKTELSPVTYSGKDRIYAYLGGAYTKMVYNISDQYFSGFTNENALIEVQFPITEGFQTIFQNSSSINTVIFDNLTQISGTGAPFQNSTIKNLIIKTSSNDISVVPCTMRSAQPANAFKNLPQLQIYVPDELVDTYKNATNWSVIEDKIYPISDYYSEVSE